MNKHYRDNLIRASEPEPALIQKVGRGTLWLAAARMSSIILGLARTIILARLLAPSDFGMIGIALLAIAVLESFSQSGFERALIQRRKDIKEFLDTVWTVSALRGVFLFAILFFGAPFIAGFFSSPTASLVLKVMAVSFILRGLTNIGVVYFKKDMVFSKQFLYQLSEVITVICVSIPLAFILRNVWALVWGTIAGSLVRLVVSYAIHPYRPGLNFHLRMARELFGFGKWIYGSTILVFLITYGDNALVGKVLGITALGFYVMAYRLSNLPTTEIAQVVSQVTFPAFSKIQTDLGRVKGAYLRVLQLVTFISLPLAAAVFVLSQPFVELFLGDKWMPMIGALKLLCVAGVLRAIQNTFGGVFSGIGKPEIVTKIAALNMGLLALIIYPATIKFAIAGTSAAVVISFFVSVCYGVRQVRRVLGIPYSEFGKVIIIPVIGVLIFVLVVTVIQLFPSYRVNIWSFFSLTAASIIIYLGAILLLGRLCDYDLKELAMLLAKGIKLNNKSVPQKNG